MGSVTVLYIGVVSVVVIAGLTQYDEHAMGHAASQFLGPIGQKVIVVGAIFSMLSASNASIMAGSRVALAMSQNRHLPSLLSSIHSRFKTPLHALGLTGILIGFFILFFHLENLAHYADAVLLVALSVVNFALISHRKRFPNLERPFRVPLVPLLPILGILANLYLIVIQVFKHPYPFLAGLLSLGCGLGIFLISRKKQV